MAARRGAGRFGGLQRDRAGQGQTADGDRRRRRPGGPERGLRAAAVGLAGHPAGSQGAGGRAFGPGHQRVDRQQQDPADAERLSRRAEGEVGAGAGLRAQPRLSDRRPLLFHRRPAEEAADRGRRPQARRAEARRAVRFHRRPAQSAGHQDPVRPRPDERGALARPAQPVAHRAPADQPAHPFALRRAVAPVAAVPRPAGPGLPRRR
ncbi:hypothetical protein D9M71_466710 [compost metagenome]